MTQSNITSATELVTNIFGDRYLPLVNGKQFEEIAYSTFFDIELLAQLSDEFTFYIFIGSDSGMLLKHLKKLNIDPTSIYFFIEDKNVLQQLNKYIIDIQTRNIIISSIDNWQKRAKDADIIKYIEVDRVQIINSFSAKEHVYTFYSDISTQLNNELNQLKWVHPDKFQKKIYLQRQIENCAENINPTIQLKKRLQGKPALILAGGPSLDKHIDWVEKHQQYYIVIAVSRIARRLLLTKIIPDIFVTADPFDSAFSSSKEMLAFGEKSILISQNYAHPKLIGQWQGEHFYLGDLLPWETDYKPENTRGIGPTVANCAIHIAIQMGIINQILFGVDLCYSASGFSHISFTDEYEQGADLGFTGISIKTNDNHNAETTYELSEARTSISLLAQLVKNQGGEIINPAPGSAHIDNVLYQTVDTISVPIDSIDGYLTITNQVEFPKPEKKVLHYSKLLEEHNKLIKHSYQILLYTKAIVNSCSAEKNKHNSSDNQINISKFKQELEQHAKIISIIESFGINGHYDFVHPDKINNPDDKNYHIKRYYTSLYIACDSFKELILDSIQRIKVRIMELSTEKDIEQVNIQKILQKWKQDHHYARIVLLKNKNPHLYQQFGHKNKQEYKQLFKDICFIPKNKQASKQQANIKLENIEKKLYHFFQTNDRENIALTMEQINHLNNNNSTALIHLAQGYLYELDCKIDQAILQYLDANSEQTLESALKRILDITLKQGDIENTIAVLKALSDISSEYLLQLANLYQLAKHHKDALDIYSLYIDSNPDDILALIKMGLLYRFLEIFDGSEFVFKHIISIDNNNQTAIYYLNQLHNKQVPPEKNSLLNEAIPSNRIDYKSTDYITLDDYQFYWSTLDSDFSVERLQQANKSHSIGFSATRKNINNRSFIQFIKQLQQQFTTVNFVIFFFDELIKNELYELFAPHSPAVQFVKPETIYDIADNVEIYIHNGNNNTLCSDFSEAFYKSETNTILTNNCKNILCVTYTDEVINETIEQTSKRMADSIIMKNYQALGFTDIELSTGNEQFANMILNKAINLHPMRNNKLTYNKSDLTYIKFIEFSLNNNPFIHFIHEFTNKVSLL